MGPLGMPEIIMIFLILFILFVTMGGGIALVWYLSSRRKPPQLPQGPKSVQERLSELDDLRSRHLISEAEHEEKRKQILGGL